MATTAPHCELKGVGLRSTMQTKRHKHSKRTCIDSYMILGLQHQFKNRAHMHAQGSLCSQSTSSASDENHETPVQLIHSSLTDN